MEIFLMLVFFDEIIIGLGYLLVANLAAAAINFIISNIAKIFFTCLAIFCSVKIIKKYGEKCLIPVFVILIITVANYMLADILYHTSPNYRFSKDSDRQVTLVRCDSEFQIRDINIHPGNVLILEELKDNKKWSTSVIVLNKGTSRFYAQEPLALILSNSAVTKLTTTTKPVADKLEEECETVVKSSNDELLELVKETEQNLDSTHVSSRSEQMAHYANQIIGSSFSDMENVRFLYNGDVIERTILTFGENTVHVKIGKYKYITDNDSPTYSWEEVSIISETDTTYKLEFTLFGGLKIRTPSTVYKVNIDDTFTVKSISIYDD